MFHDGLIVGCVLSTSLVYSWYGELPNQGLGNAHILSLLDSPAEVILHLCSMCVAHLMVIRI